jgi:hypothetical protein
MYAYAKKYQSDEIIVIYPRVDAFKDEEEIRFFSDDYVCGLSPGGRKFTGSIESVRNS